MKQLTKYVCECKCVTRHEIIKGIRKFNANSVKDIQIITKASTGCGRCKLLVNKVIVQELGKQKAKGKQLTLDFEEN